MNNYNKIKLRLKTKNKGNENNYNSNSMRNSNSYKINIGSQRLLKKIDLGKNKKRINSSIIIINKINNLIQKKNMKSFSGIEYNVLKELEHEKINEFKDFLDKIISDFEN